MNDICTLEALTRLSLLLNGCFFSHLPQKGFLNLFPSWLIVRQFLYLQYRYLQSLLVGCNYMDHLVPVSSALPPILVLTVWERKIICSFLTEYYVQNLIPCCQITAFPPLKGSNLKNKQVIFFLLMWLQESLLLVFCLL